MSYIRGRGIFVYVTTEHTTAKIVLTGSTPDSGGTHSVGVGSTSGVGNLGAVTGSDTSSDLHKLKFVEGIDVTKAWEDENTTFYGGSKEYHIPIRKKWELTITRKTEDKNLSKLMSGARWGAIATASGNLHTGLTELTATSGYRLYVFDGSKWDIFYHGIIPADGYTETSDPNKTLVHTLKFVGNEWSSSLDAGANGLNITASLAIE